MDSCLFCRIAAGEIPSTKVYEDEQTLAFRDIDPKAPSHVLVIPKEHYVSIHDIPSERSDLLAAVMHAAAESVKAENLSESGYRVVINSGADGGQLVPHLHLHILGGRSLHWPPG